MVVAVEIAEHLRWPGCSAGAPWLLAQTLEAVWSSQQPGISAGRCLARRCCCPPARKGREWGVQAGQLALVDRAAGEATGERSGDATAPSLEKSDAQAMVSLAR